MSSLLVSSRRWMVYWPIAAALMALIVAGADARTRLDNQEMRISRLENAMTDIAAKINQLQISEARTEQSALDTQLTTHRIDHKLDVIMPP